MGDAVSGGSTGGGSNGGADGTAEMYVCTKGFGGRYRISLRRMWGQVTADRVTVEVCKHYGTDKAEMTRQQIPMTEDEVAVVFDLEEGRRLEDIDELKLANAARKQLAANRAVLAQQLNQVRDDSSLSSLLRDRNRFLVGVDPRIRIQQPVGFAPVIQQIPEGAMMFGLAVVSADRRYVRVEVLPNFQQIGRVTTYNLQSGAQGAALGGAGGGGFGGGQAGGGLGGGFGGGGLGGGGGFGGGGLGGGGGFF